MKWRSLGFLTINLLIFKITDELWISVIQAAIIPLSILVMIIDFRDFKNET